MTAIQISTDRVAGVELQPLAQLSVPLPILAETRGWITSSEDDPQLGMVTVVALQLGNGRYLLRTYEDGADVTEIHTPDSGDPTEQLRRLLKHFASLNQALQHWWDGTTWRPAPLPKAA